jgi:hypothetical protein
VGDTVDCADLADVAYREAVSKAQGCPDSHNTFANLHGTGIPERDPRQTARIGIKDREIAVWILPDDPSDGQAPLCLGLDLKGRLILDDVVIGDNQAVRRDHETGSLASGADDCDHGRSVPLIDFGRLEAEAGWDR